MIKISADLLNRLSEEAKASKRKRMNYNFHESMEDRLHRMLNAIEPGSYIQAHKHENPDKAEAFVVVRGRFLVLLFDNQGNVSEHAVLSPQSQMVGVDIKAGTWHTIISLEEGSVIYECKDGPWEKSSDKNFAPWAPKEGDPECKAYMQALISKYA